MIQGLSPWTRRVGLALVLLAVLLLVFGAGLHLGDHCHEAGHDSACAFAVLVAGSTLALFAFGVCLAVPPRGVPRRALAFADHVGRDLRSPGARAPPSFS